MQYDCQNGKRTSRDLALPPMIVLEYLQIAVSQITASSHPKHPKQLIEYPWWLYKSAVYFLLLNTNMYSIHLVFCLSFFVHVFMFANMLFFRSLYLCGDHLIWSAFDIGPCKTWMYIRTTMDIRPMSFKTFVLSTSSCFWFRMCLCLKGERAKACARFWDAFNENLYSKYNLE